MGGRSIVPFTLYEVGVVGQHSVVTCEDPWPSPLGCQLAWALDLLFHEDPKTPPHLEYSWQGQGAICDDPEMAWAPAVFVAFAGY